MPKDLTCRTSNPFGVFSFRFSSTVPATSKKLLIKYATSTSKSYTFLIKNIITLCPGSVNGRTSLNFPVLCSLSCKKCVGKLSLPKAADYRAKVVCCSVSFISFSRLPTWRPLLPARQSYHPDEFP